MSHARLLYITGDTLTVFTRQGKTVSRALECANDAEAQASLAALIKENPDWPNTLLVDLVEEEFQIESTPWLFTGRDQLFARTAARIFRQTPWCHWRLLGRESEGRRDARVLFTAITNSDPLKPWLSILDRLQAPLAAIRSAPHLSEKLIKPLAITAPATLLLSEQRSSGLRQTFFRDGQLVISRLAPVRHDETAAGYAGFVHDEITKTTRYLQRLQLLPFNLSLDVYLLNSPGGLEAVSALGKAGDKMRLHLLPLGEVAEKFGCPWEAEEFQADYLFAFLALTTRGNDYATIADRRYAVHRHLRQAVNGATLTLLFGALAMAGNYGADIHIIRQQSETLAEEMARYEKVYSEHADQTLPDATDVQFIRDTVITADTLAELNLLPNRTLIELSRLLTAYPSFRPTEISWQSGTREQLAAAKISVPETPGTEESGVETAAVFYQATSIRGVISLEKISIRQAIEQFSRLTGEAARTIGNVIAVEVIEAPIDLSPTGTVSRRSDAAATRASFTFRLLCRTTDGERNDATEKSR